ncbi:hypothetical protein PZN02_002016 [Sinorhizobium garamanticum]|uniref:Uncharacterized protein n=1 Tax=Sinorhizobium garamanticum TaxID=680247 RepID=A0ABY8D9Y5_9HYPH|nr:hypothetical protein [Sinorhizobium garamanticum]WEX85783.1 hypothetical protein PZN02_002016 [Sinorhizobium garamanticum]
MATWLRLHGSGIARGIIIVVPARLERLSQTGEPATAPPPIETSGAPSRPAAHVDCTRDGAPHAPGVDLSLKPPNAPASDDGARAGCLSLPISPLAAIGSTGLSHPRPGYRRAGPIASTAFGLEPPTDAEQEML